MPTACGEPLLQTREAQISALPGQYWPDDYARKFKDYEAMDIPEY